jgi:hypothetical protein
VAELVLAQGALRGEPFAPAEYNCPGMPVEKRFDVFLSYNQEDEAWGRRLKTALADRGINAWFAPDEIDAGSRFPSAIERGMKTSRAIALIVYRFKVG